MKIGITVGLTKDHESLWINGIKLNILNLAKLLQQIPNYEVFILDTSNKVEDLTKVVWDYDKYKVFKFNDMKYQIDLLFVVGTSLPKSILDEIRIKNGNFKVIKYHCGNNYVIDMERVIFNRLADNIVPSWEGGHEQTWLVPQQEYHNKEYYQTIYKQKDDEVITVPFIWDSEQLDRIVDRLILSNKKTPYYEKTNQPNKKISVLEPNLNVVKYAMIPIMIAEKVFREEGQDAFKQIYISSGNSILKNSYFKKMMAYLDMVKSNPIKIKFIPRYPITTVLTEETDVVLSHQWGNPLNYAYLDALHFNYPLVHNADFIEDAGYYYPHFEVNKGAEMLKKALSEHDDNSDNYYENNKIVLDRYRASNPELIEIYRKLIENLFEPNKHSLSYEYDKKTNLYK